jgi:hypothetical protein
MTSNPQLADVMIDLCTKAGSKQTIDPADVARAFAEATNRVSAPWQGYLQSVRDTAVALAREGRIVIYRKGALADPETFRGVYRLGAPNIS